MYYHARYYNPALGRFVSPDSVVPGNASGGLDGVALKPLTVDFHEPGFATQLAKENTQPFWFEMTDRQRQQAGSPWEPANPQALNRYSYTLNNPVRWTDPSGHVIPIIVVIVIGAILVGGALVAVTSPSTGMKWSDYDWTYWPLPWFPTITNDDTNTNDNSSPTNETPQAPPIPSDPTQPPGPGWEWRGKGAPGSNEGAWYNPQTGESLHPDLSHSDPIGSHWDYKDPSGRTWRVYPDRRVEPKS